TLDQAAEMACRACASPGGGCQFLGTAATSQVVGEALGMALPHSALSPSGHPVWVDMATRSARAVLAIESSGLRSRDILTEAAVQNAMVLHAAFGRSEERRVGKERSLHKSVRGNTNNINNEQNISN